MWFLLYLFEREKKVSFIRFHCCHSNLKLFFIYLFNITHFVSYSLHSLSFSLSQSPFFLFWNNTKKLKSHGFPSGLLGASLPEASLPSPLPLGLPPEAHQHPPPLHGPPRFPRARHCLARSPHPNAGIRIRLRHAYPGNPPRSEVPRPPWPTRNLRRLSHGVREKRWDQTASQLSTHIPPRMFGPLDGVRSENVPSLQNTLYTWRYARYLHWKTLGCVWDLWTSPCSCFLASLMVFLIMLPYLLFWGRRITRGCSVFHSFFFYFWFFLCMCIYTKVRERLRL